jgi:hypothetical protein
MRRIEAAVVLVLAGALPALADEIPARKAGLWEITTILESRNGAGMTLQQCVDAATDQMMMSNAGPFARAACPRRDVRRSGASITIDSTCTYKDKTATVHAVVTGSLDSAYTMTVTSQSDAMPLAGKSMTMSGKWLGPCAADQKPGDIIMGNGAFRMNILEMQKKGLSEGIPLPR